MVTTDKTRNNFLEERFGLNTGTAVLTEWAMKYWNKLQKEILKVVLLTAFKHRINTFLSGTLDNLSP